MAIICQNQPNLVFDRTIRQNQPEPIRQSIPANTLSNLPAIHHQYCKDFPASLNEWTLHYQPALTKKEKSALVKNQFFVVWYLKIFIGFKK